MMRYSALHVPHDLKIFLYVGAAKLKERDAYRRLSEGLLDPPLMNRLPLVEALHDFLSSIITGGRSKRTFAAHYSCLKELFSYIDDEDLAIDIGSAEVIFIAWANEVSQRVQRNNIARATASYWVSKVAKSLEDVLSTKSSALIKKTRLGKTKSGRSSFSVSAKHKKFEETQEFTSDLLDLIEHLSGSDSLSMLPLRLTTKLSEKVDFNRGGNGRNLTVNKNAEQGLELNCQVGNFQSERAFMNLRMMCEFHYFIFFTGANLIDAWMLELASIKGWVEENGRRYRVYKERKGGEVKYKIYERFVPHFEAYLEFRSMVVLVRPSPRLFPFIRMDNENQSDEFQARPLRLLLKRLDRQYISPSAMRKYLLNDVFEYSKSDKIAAGVGQHGVSTFIKSYIAPNLEVAAVEWTRFFGAVEQGLVSVAPGKCSSLTPIKLLAMEHLGAEPNCENSAGCLFCEQYRGVASFDYIWSLLSYRVIKNNEGFFDSSNIGSGMSSLLAVLKRIDQIVAGFRVENDTCELLYLEALSRCAEYDYHPKWSGYIELMELT